MPKLVSHSLTDLEERRQQALMVAKQCTEILQDNFGATEVILCGSLAGESPWHWHSDIDLAVRGMTKDQVWDAYSEIDIIPNKVAQMQKAGYIPVATFILPENCWTEHFYAPQVNAQKIFLENNAGNKAAVEFIENQRHETQLY